MDTLRPSWKTRIQGQFVSPGVEVVGEDVLDALSLEIATEAER